MAVPRSKEARLYYRCAFQRYEEAEILLREAKPTGAVYLAGYGIECMLKALILSSIPTGEVENLLRSFRGRQAHDYEWLRARYHQKGGAMFPPEIRRSFALANEWSTEIRYSPEVLGDEEADGFLRAAQSILSWADKRL